MKCRILIKLDLIHLNKFNNNNIILKRSSINVYSFFNINNASIFSLKLFNLVVL